MKSMPKNLNLTTRTVLQKLPSVTHIQDAHNRNPSLRYQHSPRPRYRRSPDRQRRSLLTTLKAPITSRMATSRAFTLAVLRRTPAPDLSE